MSPASGDNIASIFRLSDAMGVSFHSINVPSEWGQGGRKLVVNEGVTCFHSINVPSEWGHDYLREQGLNYESFHSINVPSEWGHNKR